MANNKGAVWSVELIFDNGIVVECDCEDEDCDKEHGLGGCSMQCGREASGVYSPGISIVALCTECHMAKRWPRWAEIRPNSYPEPDYEITLRATAMPPNGTEAIATFEAETSEDLAGQCIDSGLVTDVRVAVLFGVEIGRVMKTAHPSRGSS